MEKKKIVSELVNLKGEKAEKISLPGEIFAAKLNPVLVAQTIRVYLANQRQGTQSTKTRAQVSGSTRKLYRQKGTGKARHGDIKAPIFIGGGIAFGPKPRDFSLKINQKMKKKALFSVIAEKFQQKKIIFVKGLEKIGPKTKQLTTFLEKIFKSKEKILKRRKLLAPVLLVLGEKTDDIRKAGRNVENLEMIMANQLNSYTVLKSQAVIFSEKAIDLFQKTFVKEGKE